MGFNGFQVLNISFDESSDSPHCLFFRKHSGKKDDENSGRTLFIANVPNWCGEAGLKNIFCDCGFITAVHLVDKPGHFEKLETPNVVMKHHSKDNFCFKYAYIVFKDESSISTALELSSSVIRYASIPKRKLITGLEKWINAYAERYPEENLIQKDADEYMRLFDTKELEEKEALKDGQEADDNGWMTVPVKKTITQKTTTENPKDKRINKKLEKKKRKEKELMNFYMFQQRESKRDKIATLRQKFEEDKKRITQMRQLRKFKPF